MIAFEPSMLTKPRPGAIIDLLHPINRGLIGLWLFNEGSGSRLADISGKKNRGIITNVDLASAWAGSLQGGALRFDGINDHVIVPRSNSLRPLPSISVIAYINGSGVGAFDYIASHYNATGNQRSWTLQTSAGGDLLTVVLSGDGTATGAGNAKSYTTSAGFIAFDTTWHQVGFTFDGPSSTLELYVDGRRDAQVAKGTDDAITSLHDSTSDIAFGSQGSGSGNWDGSLSYLSIHDRALTEREIAHIYTNPYTGISA